MGALLDAVPAGGADHTEHHRDLATAIEAVPAAYQPLDSDLTAIAALTTTAYGRGLLSLANQAALQAEAGGSALVAGVDYPTSATVTLSSAQILDLHNTPITLVAAPGAGKYLIPHAIVVWGGYGTTPYTVSDDLSIRYVTGDDISTDAATAAVFNYSGFRKLLLLDDVGGDDSIVNKGIETYVRTGSITDGDGTLTVTVWYTVEDVPA